MASPLPILILITAILHAPAAKGEEEQGLIEVVVLAGQYNMVGRGGVRLGMWDRVVPLEDVYPGGTVLRLTEFLEWEDAREPLHQGIDLSYGAVGVGPGLSFGAAVAKSQRLPPSSRVGLVPCAVSNSIMSDWQKGEPVYEIMVRRAEASTALGGRITSLIWYGGESDARLPVEASLYQERLQSMITSFRADLDINVPVFVVGITAATDVELLYQTVRGSQRSIVSSLPGVYFVDAEGLELQPDGVYLSTKGQAQLGELLAQSYVTEVAPLLR